jgi:hypothetical protein
VCYSLSDKYGPVRLNICTFSEKVVVEEKRRQSTVDPSGKHTRAVSNISAAGLSWIAWLLGACDYGAQADLIGKGRR